MSRLVASVPQKSPAGSQALHTGLDDLVQVATEETIKIDLMSWTKLLEGQTGWWKWTDRKCRSLFIAMALATRWGELISDRGQQRDSRDRRG
jgi:hypothetical protein